MLILVDAVIMVKVLVVCCCWEKSGVAAVSESDSSARLRLRSGVVYIPMGRSTVRRAWCCSILPAQIVHACGRMYVACYVTCWSDVLPDSLSFLRRSCSHSEWPRKAAFMSAFPPSWSLQRSCQQNIGRKKSCSFQVSDSLFFLNLQQFLRKCGEQITGIGVAPHELMSKCRTKFVGSLPQALLLRSWGYIWCYIGGVWGSCWWSHVRSTGYCWAFLSKMLISVQQKFQNTQPSGKGSLVRWCGILGIPYQHCQTNRPRGNNKGGQIPGMGRSLVIQQYSNTLHMSKITSQMQWSYIPLTSGNFVASASHYCIQNSISNLASIFAPFWTSNCIMLACPFAAALCRQLSLYLSTTFRSAPKRTSSSRTSTCPVRANEYVCACMSVRTCYRRDTNKSKVLSYRI